MKLIVAGGRTLTDYDLLKRNLDKLFSYDIEIVSGTANGADKLGEQWAKENYIPIKQFPANWDLYGKSAGYKRNEQMAQYADTLIAFWDGESKGTKHMIDLAHKYKLKVIVIKY